MNQIAGDASGVAGGLQRLQTFMVWAQSNPSSQAISDLIDRLAAHEIDERYGEHFVAAQSLQATALACLRAMLTEAQERERE